MAIPTRFTELVGCTDPIQSAPMGLVSPPALVAAVCAGGGVGTSSRLAVGSPAELARVLDELSAAGPVAVNFLMPILDLEGLEVAAARARIIDLFWGPPNVDIVERVHQGGALALWQVGTADDARKAVDAGCDIVAAQGAEAGGHCAGSTPLLPLLDEVLEVTGDVPVLAAGGIGTARATAAALAAGADGVRVGTRFIASSESGAVPEYVDAVLAATADDSVPTGRYSNGCPLCPSTHRVLRGAIEAAEALDDDVAMYLVAGDRRIPVPRFGAYPPAGPVEGHVEAAAMYAGAGVGAITGVKPAAEIVRELSDGAAALLRERGERVG